MNQEPADPSTLRETEFARFYDLEYSDFSDDVEFYVQHALALDPERERPVLELGCGTGRILLALAEEGFSVTGVDASEGMLALCSSHAAQRGLQDRIRLVKDDMRAAPPAGSYCLALIALNTFAYLRTTADQLAALRNVRQALSDRGMLIVDLTPPLPHLLPPSDNEVLHQGTYHDPETGVLVHKLVTGYARPSEQLHPVRLMYDLEGLDGGLRRLSREDVFRWTGRYEMELLLQAAGFTLDNLYGSYELDPYTDESERMIFVARA